MMPGYCDVFHTKLMYIYIYICHCHLFCQLSLARNTKACNIGKIHQAMNIAWRASIFSMCIIYDTKAARRCNPRALRSFSLHPAGSRTQPSARQPAHNHNHHNNNNNKVKAYRAGSSLSTPQSNYTDARGTCHPWIFHLHKTITPRTVGSMSSRLHASDGVISPRHSRLPIN